MQLSWRDCDRNLVNTGAPGHFLVLLRRAESGFGDLINSAMWVATAVEISPTPTAAIRPNFVMGFSVGY